MRAAVLHKLGDVPIFEKDFPLPKLLNVDQHVVISVKAASVKNLDKIRASGKHYTNYSELPTVVGVDGVGHLETTNQRVYAFGISGMIAEKAIVDKSKVVPLPDEIDDVSAAALPNAVMGASLALTDRAHLKSGQVVLVNGATGVTGRVAVQLAKLYGASKVIATGRNQESLKILKNEYGVDQVISLGESDEEITKQISQIHQETPIDIVIDYLWGHPIELIFKSLKGSGNLHGFSHPVKVVTVGSMAGENVAIPSSLLRSTAIEILGSGLGSISESGMKEFFSSILPQTFKWVAEGKLKIETHVEPLENVAAAWQENIDPGKRLVITI
ncbi:predicted protein [Naegleria gruberi]|uniref:Predicted protein n=1 Tax=Naegleria gruberi TaxID=5762 RepID=D2VMV8_NAEGR|nr:uncharacterized protein NAEGRDRAFT_70277 [Naegleria gruberi]EFC41891.1 predicted protein [Naegleria gruberi]|eukprot:XP_002674635.1 predicted protein [Naegleria gruberi strain NEG-M]